MATISQAQLNFSGTSSAGTSETVTLGSGITAGNLLTVVVAYAANATVTITPPSGSWAQDAIIQSTVYATGAIFRLNVGSAQAGQTSWAFTYSGTAHNGVLIAAEWHSTTGWLASPLDKTASTNGSGTALASGTTATTTQAQELWLAGYGIANDTAQFNTLSSGWSSSAPLLTGSATSTVNRGFMAWQFATAKAAASATVTSTTSAAWDGVIATYKTGPGGLLMAGPP